MRCRGMMGVSAALALAALGAAPVALASAEEITIAGVAGEKAITCDERDVVIEGANQHLTLRGRCAQVTIHGVGQVVHVEGLGRADVDGANNLLEWERALRGDQPDLHLTGVDNRSVQVGPGASAPPAKAGAKPSTVTVEGTDSRVVVGGGGVRVESKPNRRPEGTAALRVTASDVDETHDCAGGNASVEGSDDRLTLSNCPELIVTGGGNRIVLLGPVRRIRLLGGDNQVQWSEGEGGRPPKVELLGGDNRVTRK